MAQWQLQDAKARLSEVVKKATREGPQHITVHGEPAAVVISEAEYRRLRRRPKRLLEMLRESPLAEVELDLTRDRTPARKLDL